MKTELMEQQLMQHFPASELLGEVPRQSLPGYLNLMIGRRGLSTDAVAELSALNRASLYKILNGSTRSPSRNVLLRLALTLELEFHETQDLLKLGGQASLSGQRERDILISDGIIHRRSIDEVNNRLLSYGFADLYKKG